VKNPLQAKSDLSYYYLRTCVDQWQMPRLQAAYVTPISRLGRSVASVSDPHPFFADPDPT
jgi:hypothetical protein